MTDHIPGSLKSLFEELETEVVWLHGRWIIYRQLFGTSEERVDLLNASAGTFFQVLQTLMLDDVSLSIGRLADSAGSGSRRNVSLRALLEDDAVRQDPGLVSTLVAQIELVDRNTQPFCTLRHKRVAHRDLKHALGVDGSMLPAVSRTQVESALLHIRNVMNSVHVHFGGGETAYEQFWMIQDGEALVSVLKRGLAYQQAEAEQLISWDYLDRSRFGRA